MSAETMNGTAAIRKAAVGAELGRTGIAHWGGQIQEELLRELRGLSGIRIYREMEENDAIIGAVLFAIRNLARQVEWSITPASDAPEDEAVAQFVRECLFEDMSSSWPEMLSDILTFLPYGWAYLETVYKRRTGASDDPSMRSRFTDGRYGWRKWALRGQDTLYKWDLDEAGGVQAMVQSAPPDWTPRTIPIEVALLFRNDARKNNPEGRSVLRSAYRSWYFKKKMEEIEGIGVERDLAGMPMIEPPPGVDLWNANDPKMVSQRAAAEKFVRNVRRDLLEGITLPSGWKFSLVSTGGRRNFDTGAIIVRYEQRMAMSVMADFILLGTEGVGSWALATSKTSLFNSALTSFLDSITGVVNRHGIPRLLALNGIPPERQPSLAHGNVATPSLAELGQYITALTGAGVPLLPEDGDYLRQVAGMPTNPEMVAKRGPALARVLKRAERDLGVRGPALAELGVALAFLRQRLEDMPADVTPPEQLAEVQTTLRDVQAVVTEALSGRQG